MAIADLHLNHLRNEEHYQFHTDFKKLIESNDPATLKIGALFTSYAQMYSNEGEALDLIRKSALTEDIAQADSYRDSIFRGMCDAVKSAEKHFNPATQQAATRLRVVLDHYGNVAVKGYDEETAAISKLVADLEKEYSADMAATGLTGWVSELKTRNNNFDALKKNRYSEASEKTMLRMKQVRVDIDNKYHEITNRINALIIVEGGAAYAAFVNEMNARINSYSKTLAQRKGRNAKDNDATGAAIA
jgi:hypothetical protein